MIPLNIGLLINNWKNILYHTQIRLANIFLEIKCDCLIIRKMFNNIIERTIIQIHWPRHGLPRWARGACWNAHRDGRKFDFEGKKTWVLRLYARPVNFHGWAELVGASFSYHLPLYIDCPEEVWECTWKSVTRQIHRTRRWVIGRVHWRRAKIWLCFKKKFW